MRAYTKYKLKKIGFIAFSLIFAITVISVTVGVVLAATNQMMATSVNVTYVSKEVAGSVSASYKREGDANETALLTEKGSNKIVFTGEETTTNEGGSFSADSPIMLTATQSEVVFKYSFTNTGDADYLATIEATNNETNLEMTISKDGTNFINIEDYSLVVFNNTSVPEDYFVKFKVLNLAKNAETELNFKWDLKSISKDAVAIYNNQAYEDFDEVLALAINESQEARTVNAQNVADESVQTKIITLIKDIENSGTFLVDGEELVVRAEKSVVLTHVADETFCNISAGSGLVLGLAYDDASINYMTNITTTLITGAGNITMNKAVVENSSNEAGTAIDVTGRVDFIGGEIKNFAVGIELSNAKGFRISGDLVNCLKTFSNSGVLEITESCVIENTTISNTMIKINIDLEEVLGENISEELSYQELYELVNKNIHKFQVIFSNVTFSGFEGSAIYAERGFVSLNSCLIENCGDSAIKTSFNELMSVEYPGLELNSTIIKNSTSLSYGGAICALNNIVLSINDSTITDCSAVEGGAVYIDGSALGLVEMNNSTIANSSATEKGGGVRLIERVMFTMNDSTITNCHAVDGGGIYKNEVFEDLDLQLNGTSAISNNTATGNGGGIFVEDLSGFINYQIDLVLTGSSVISGNTAGASGGGIYSHGETSTNLKDSASIVDNEAKNGGGVYLHSIDGDGSSRNPSRISYITFHDFATLSGNSAEVNGGGIYSTLIEKEENNRIIEIFNSSTISNNTAGNKGGAIYGDSILMEGGKIFNCSAVEGGAIYSLGEIELSGQTIKGCTASKHGGAIFLSGYKSENIIGGNFLNNTAATNGGSIAVYASIKISADFSFDNSELVGGINGACLYIGSGAEVEIVNSSFNGIIGGGSGGVLCNSGYTTIKNTTITNCTAPSGGAIFSNENLNISDSSIDGCTSKYGGAIYYRSKKLTMTNVNVSNCVATTDGGMIFTQSGTIEIIDSTVENCSARSGGVIFADSTMLEIENTSINGCSATSSGGAIYSKGITTLKGTDITSCSGKLGGAVYSTNEINIDGGTYFDCEASSEGGAIYASGKIVLANQEIKSCKANKGGAIYASGKNEENSISGSFLDNVATTNGGAIYLSGCVVDITANISNTGTNIVNAENGGAIYANNESVVNVSSGTISGIKVSGNGGAIYCQSVTSSSDIENCSAANGGAIYVTETITITSTDGLTNINNCSATNEGGAIYVLGKATINSNINNCSSVNGGAVYGGSSSVIKVEGGTISNSVASGNGGAIYGSNIQGCVNLENCSAVNGGGIYAKSVLELSNNTISGCSAQNGGGIYLTGTNASNFIISTFIDNTATTNGGSIFITGNGYAKIISDFSNTETTINNAQNGGGIYTETSTQLTINGSFTNLNSTGSGAAICSTTELIIQNVDFTFCKGVSGGAIYSRAGLEIENSNFDSCSAQYGAVAYCTANIFSVIGGTISKCISTSNGGAVYASNSVITIEEVEVSECSATNGGLIYLNNGSLTISNISADHCSATSNGGVIYSNATTVISESVMEFCTASYGGAIHTTGTLTVTGGDFIGCSAKQYGGAIYAADITMSDGFISSCTAVNGGAICATDKISLSNQEISLCSADYGGAVYISGTDVQNSISGSFINNMANQNGGSIALYDGGVATINVDFSATTSDANAVNGGAIYIANGSKAVVNGGSFESLKASQSGGAISNVGTLEIAGDNEAIIFKSCSAKIGGAIANMLYNASSGWLPSLTVANAYIGNVEFELCTSQAGESNAIANIGNLYITDTVTQKTSDQDICLARLTLLGSTAQGAIYNNTIINITLNISFADAELNGLNLESLLLDVEGTKSQNNAIISSLITVVEYPE